MSANKPSDTEEEFFAREEAAKRRKAAIEKARETEQSERDALKAAHFMRCPKCGWELQSVTFREVQVDRCFHCHGTWFDEGELERLVGKEPGFLHRIAAVFRRE